MRPNVPELTEDQRQFFDQLFAGQDGCFIELRVLPSRARTFCPVGDRVVLARFLAAHAEDNQGPTTAHRDTTVGGRGGSM